MRSNVGGARLLLGNQDANAPAIPTRRASHATLPASEEGETPHSPRSNLAPCPQRRQLALRNPARQRRETAIGRALQPLRIGMFHRLAHDGGDLFRRLDPARRHVDRADENLLVRQQPDQRHRNLRARAFQRHAADGRLVQRGKDRLVLAPFLAERFLPLDVGLDAVAVADVHGRLAFEARDCGLQRRHAPFHDLAHEDVERRLVELDDVDAERLELARFFVQSARESHRHVGAPAIMAVRDRVADRHRAGQREFQLAFRMLARDRGFVAMHATLALHRRGHGRHFDRVAIVADAHRRLLVPVDALDLFEKPVHEMDARLFAVADDVDAVIFLQLQPQQRGVALETRSSAPSARQAPHSFSGSASQAGFGRLPAMVVGNFMALPRSPATMQPFAPPRNLI